MTFVEVATDCWITPPDGFDPFVQVVGGIDLDPFHDPASLVPAARVIDVRQGGDAYCDDLGDDLRRWLNGPYSGDYPARTARLATETYRDRGGHVANLCPAAPGSTYWRQHVWPSVCAVVWMGRYAFIAGRDMHDKHGRLVARRGERVHGNRTEISLLYHGPKAAAVVREYAKAGYVGHVHRTR